MERNRSFSIFEDTGQSFKTGTLNYYIVSVSVQCNDRESPTFKKELYNFKRAVKLGYIEARNSGRSQIFLAELFDSIFYRRVSNNVLPALVMADAIIQVDVGSKVTKANRIATEIIKLPPQSNFVVYEYLDNILQWLYKVQKSNVHLIVQPLADNARDWNLSGKDDLIVSSFMLLRILLKRFPSYFQSQPRGLGACIARGTQRFDNDVKEQCLKFLHIVLKLPQQLSNSIITEFCAYATAAMDGGRINDIVGLEKYVEIILKESPVAGKNLVMREIPFSLLNSKDKMAKVAFFIIAPIIARTMPDKFTQDVFATVFEKLIPYCKRRSSIRKEALVCLGKLIFERHGKFIEEERIALSAHKHQVIKKIDCPEAVFAYCALITTNYTTFIKDLDLLWSQPLTNYLIDGLYGTSLAFPSEFHHVKQGILSVISKVIINPKSQPAQLIVAFKAIMDLGLESMIVLPAMLHYSLHMASSNINVRKLAANFCIKYHNMNPKEDTLLRILYAASIEVNERLKISIIKKTHKEPLTELVVESLQPMLHEQSSEIVLEIFRYFVQLGDNPYIVSAFNRYLSEIIIAIEQDDSRRKEYLVIFLELSNIALKQSVNFDLYEMNAKRFLSPYAARLQVYLASDTNLNCATAIELLDKLFKFDATIINDINMENLIKQMSTNLAIHMSSARILSTIELVQTLVALPSVRDQILSSVVVNRLLSLVQQQMRHDIHMKILETISKFGGLDTGIIEKIIERQIDTANSENPKRTARQFLGSSCVTEPTKGLVFASIGVVVTNILEVLKDDALSVLHSPALQCLYQVLILNPVLEKGLDDAICQTLILSIRRGEMSILSSIISHANLLISVLEDKLAPLVPDAINLICNKWGTIDPILLIKLTADITLSLPAAFRPHLPRIATVMLTNLDSQLPSTVERIVDMLVSVGPEISDVPHIVYPPILNWISNNAMETKTLNKILPLLRIILVNGGCEIYYAAVLQTLIQIVQANPLLHDRALSCLYPIAILLKEEFLLYVPSLSMVFRLDSSFQVSRVISYTETGLQLPEEIQNQGKPFDGRRKIAALERSRLSMSKSEPIYQIEATIKEPDPSYDSTQWSEWAEDFFSNAIHNSPSSAIGACEMLIQKYAPLKEQICPIAIAILYSKNYQKEMRYKLSALMKVFFGSKTAPLHIKNIFLTGIDLIDLAGLQTPLPLIEVAEASHSCGRTSLALRITEKMFESGNKDVVGNLVLYNLKLHLPVAANSAIGTLQTTTQVQLFQWDDALVAYSKEMMRQPMNSYLFEGKMSCLKELNRYNDMCKEAPRNSVHYVTGLWGQNMMNRFKDAARKLEDDSPDALFYRAVYYVMEHDSENARKIIQQSRETQLARLFPNTPSDPSQAIATFASVARLNDLEDVMEIQNLSNSDDQDGRDQRIQMIKQIWDHRFNILPAGNLSAMQDIIQIHSIVIKPQDMRKEWAKFVNCAIENNQIKFAESFLPLLYSIKLGSALRIIESKIYAAKNQTQKAIQMLQDLLSHENEPEVTAAAERIISKYLIDTKNYKDAVVHIARASELDACDDVWMQSMNVNYRLYQLTKERNYAINSLEGALNGIKCTNKSTLPYAMKILALMFNIRPKYLKEFVPKIMDVECLRWEEALPQFVARLNTNSDLAQTIIKDIIINIGKESPMNVVKSLMVPVRSKDNEIPQEIINAIRVFHPDIINDAMQISNELIRVAVLQWELLEYLLSVSEDMVKRGDIDQFLELMQSHRKYLDYRGESYFEISFWRTFGPQLNAGYQMLEALAANPVEILLNVTWEAFAKIRELLKKHSMRLQNFDIQNVSPFLAKLKESKVMIPGAPKVKFLRINPLIRKVDALYKSRKIVLLGDDGNEYTFLLRGFEDTRLDERVMQLYHFINSLLEASSIPLSRSMILRTYTAIPLRCDIGLISWVEDSIPTSRIISDHRNKYKISVNVEREAAYEISPNYADLPTSSRLPAFQAGLNATSGSDLKEVLLMRSASTAKWIERRTCYTGSLASSSVVGYILGLGERTPENILIQNRTASVMHVGYQKCFEVAWRRLSDQEVVPFRLTRMFTNPLELGRVSGSFAVNCVDVMTLLRSNRNDLLALFDVFLYAPLLQWMDGPSIADFSHYANNSSEAKRVFCKVKRKLKGKEFAGESSCKDQVERLINQATNIANICAMPDYWNPWW